MDDEDLQDEPLQIRVMDYDTYSANDAIGKVSLSLNPLLLSDNKTSSSQKCKNTIITIIKNNFIMTHSLQL